MKWPPRERAADINRYTMCQEVGLLKTYMNDGELVKTDCKQCCASCCSDY